MNLQTITQNKFNFFAPLDTFEKSKDDQGNEVYRVGGIISDSTRDSDGENLDYNGFDFSDFNFINWNHNKDPKSLIGEPEAWKIIPGKGVYMSGFIYPDSEVGKDAVKLMKTLRKSKRGNQLGWSVEGQVIDRDLINPKKVTKAKITAVALCPFPKNGNTFAELLEKGFQGDDIFQKSEDLDYDLANGGQSEYFIDVTDSDGDRILIAKDGSIKVIKKAESTESARAVIKEDVEGNPKMNLQKAFVTLVKGHKEGLIHDKKIENLIKLKKFL